ncbi:hypothetical protein KP509_29G036700 [Ceratopteris richardii]|nr:hypothetical protein KP509_29G036700 [Ceratopteris richardii]
MLSTNEYEAATQTFGAFLREFEFGNVGTPDAMVEWALAPHRVIVEKLKELKPDLVITQHQTRHGIPSLWLERALETFLGWKINVIRIDLRTLDGIWDGILTIMQELGLRSESLLNVIQGRIHLVQEMCRGRGRRRVLFLQWNGSSCLSHVSASVGTWIWDVIDLVGGTNPFWKQQDASFTKREELPSHFVDLDSIKSLSLDVLILTNHALGVKDLSDRVLLHDQWVKQLFSSPSFRLVVVHGPCFLARPSPSLLVDSTEALCEILYPECQAFGHEGSLWMPISQTFTNHDSTDPEGLF